MGVPVVAQQQVGDLILFLRGWGFHPCPPSRSRAWHCHRLQCQSRCGCSGVAVAVFWTKAAAPIQPLPPSSVCHGCGHKEKKKKTQNKEDERTGGGLRKKIKCLLMDRLNLRCVIVIQMEPKYLSEVQKFRDLSWIFWVILKSCSCILFNCRIHWKQN